LSLYLDASCLLKLLFPQPETGRVMELVAAEDRVVVSTLARFEVLVQIHGRFAGGMLRSGTARALASRLEVLLRQAPCEVVPLPAAALGVAHTHLRTLPRQVHCPALDRLHLAVMESLQLRRLLTNDDAQARGARALGFEVLVPR
jgi:predicted nucleic acid-binding protein